MVQYKKTKKVQENIKQTAKEMFSKNGYDNVKVEEIAKELSIAKGLIFYHFLTKENLLTEILYDEASQAFSSVTLPFEMMDCDKALSMVFQAMFAATKPLPIAQGFFPGELPEKYHYAVDKARQEIIFPLLYGLIKQGHDEGLFKIEVVDISFQLISMGFNSFLDTHYHMFKDREYHERFLKSVAYILNSTLNPTRIKFEFQIHEKDFMT